MTDYVWELPDDVMIVIGIDAMPYTCPHCDSQRMFENSNGDGLCAVCLAPRGEMDDATLAALRQQYEVWKSNGAHE